MKERYAFISRFHKGYMVEIRTNSGLSQGEHIHSEWVKDKKAARTLASMMSARPWNF